MDYSKEFTTQSISGKMSLREPQTQSLQTLEKILSKINQNIDLTTGLSSLKKIDEQTKNELIKTVHSVSPTLADFEHDFVSLAFALATGVGKTRLMGAFITYLYTNYGIKNFFVVAPGNTVYNKLRSDLIDQSSFKYVFNGLSCFAETKPYIYDKTNFLSIKENELTPSDVHIILFDIQAFDKENVNMKKLNEILGDSFYNYLSNLEDLVLLMDESHHYRASKGLQAINELNPVLGLELTATPYVMQKSKQEKFKNVVYEYSLAKAIEAGFVRTPYAIARTGLDVTNFGEDELDHTILQDGIKCHEEIKEKLKDYAYATQNRLVKPFMMVVCKDIDHATKIENYICSKDFCNARYKDKVVRIDSKKTGAETEENTKLLLSIENSNNPIEIVIHVNMLKEGWDVNNLYTIVPLRTATSKTLREQMVGRGLRLPFGKRTGIKDLDGVYLTAHDNFRDIIKDAESGESIFSAKHIIDIADISNLSTVFVQPRLFETPTQEEESAKQFLQNSNIPETENTIEFEKGIYKSTSQKITQVMVQNNSTEPEQDEVERIIAGIQKEKEQEIKENPELQEELGINKDIGNSFNQIMSLFAQHIETTVKENVTKIAKSFISIPQISTSEKSNAIYEFVDFELDTSRFIQEPQENKIVIQNMNDTSDRTQKKNDMFVTPENLNIVEELTALLYDKPEVNSMDQKDRTLIKKLIVTLIEFYAKKGYSKKQMQNIVFFHKNAITKEIYAQMMVHFATNGKDELIAEIKDINKTNVPPNYSVAYEKDFYSNEYKRDNLQITQVTFYGMKKSVFERACFDSHDGELTFARIIDRDQNVIKWLRPDPKEFNLAYEYEGKTHNYEPDFVVETEDKKYLVEIKSDRELQNPEVLAKKECGKNYCEIARAWAIANNEKPWDYLFIPSSIAGDETQGFEYLVKRFL